MRKAWWIAATGLLVVVGLFAWRLLQDGDPRTHDLSARQGEKGAPKESGHAAASRKPPVSTPQAAPKTVTLRIEVTAEGAPGVEIFAARRKAVSKDAVWRPDSQEFLGRTGAGGRFVFRARRGTSWLLAFEADGFQSQVVPWAASDDGTMTLSLGRLVEHRLRVVDESGAAIEGAEVSVLSSGQPLLRAESAADGSVNLWFGSGMEVRVAAEGYGPRRFASDPPATVVLRREYVLGGRVAQEGGAAVGGALVAFGGWLKKPRIVQRTGPDGSFRFSGLDSGRGVLTVRAEGFADAVVSAAPGDSSVEIVLRPVVEVSGVVVHPDGTPVVDADVNLHPGGSFLSAFLDSRVKTDAEGRFRFHAVPAGRLAFQVLGSGFEHAWAEVDATSGKVCRPRILFGGGSRSFVSVALADTRGTPVRGEVNGADAGKDGRAVVSSRKPPGSRIYLRARAQKESGGKWAVTAARRAGPLVTIVMRSDARVTVVVRAPGGAPLPPGVNATILMDDYPGQDRAQDRATFSLPVWPGAPPRSARGHALTVWAQGYGSYREDPWRPPPEGGECRVVLPDAVSLSGRIVDESGEPVLAVVDAERKIPGLSGADSARHETCPTDARGAFSLSVGPKERVALSVRRPGPTPPEFLRAIRIPAGHSGPMDLGTLRIPRPVTLTGIVEGPDGRPLGGVRLDVSGLPRRTFDSPVTHADGRFELHLSDLSAGSIHPKKPGYGAWSVPVSELAAQRPLILHMEKEARLVLHTSLRFLATVRVHRPDGTGGAIASTSSCGWTTWIDGLPSGPLVLDLRFQGGGKIERRVVCESGETLSLNVDDR